jgi:hypothetical protein
MSGKHCTLMYWCPGDDLNSGYFPSKYLLHFRFHSNNLLSTIFALCYTSFPLSIIAQDTSFLGVGWDWVHLVRRPLTDLLYQPRMIDYDCGAVGGMRIGMGNRSTREKLPQCHFVHKNPTWPDVGLNPGLNGGKPATNRLSYGTSNCSIYFNHLEFFFSGAQDLASERFESQDQSLSFFWNGDALTQWSNRALSFPRGTSPCRPSSKLRSPTSLWLILGKASFRGALIF